MWVALIIISIIVGMLLLVVLCCLEHDYSKILSLDEYRYETNNGIRRVYWDGHYDFYDKANEETILKYNKYKEYQKHKNKIKKILSWFIPIFISLVLIISFSWLGAYIEKEQINGEIESYISAKTTIEMSLNNENIGGLERIELVQQAKEKNEWLASVQYQAKQWYRFYWDKENILNVDFISLE